MLDTGFPEYEVYECSDGSSSPSALLNHSSMRLWPLAPASASCRVTVTIQRPLQSASSDGRLCSGPVPVTSGQRLQPIPMPAGARSWTGTRRLIIPTLRARVSYVDIGGVVQPRPRSVSAAGRPRSDARRSRLVPIPLRSWPSSAFTPETVDALRSSGVVR
jgi:hypothetical protein